jgi:hypothetical protein
MNNVKYVDLPVRLIGFCADTSKDFIKDLNLEYGTPLTFKGLPYNPLNLTMEDIKEGPVTIKSSIFYNYD